MATKTSSSKKANQPTVDSYMKALDHPLKSCVTALLKLIRSAAPNLTEHVKWNAPSFCLNDVDVITLNLSKKDAVLIIFHRGATFKDTKTGKRFIDDDSGLLEWPSDFRAIMKLKSLSEVKENEKVIEGIVKKWIKEIEN